MKHILLTFSGNDFPIGAFQFARQLNEISPVKLNGFFLPQIDTPVYEGVKAVMEEDKSESVITDIMKRFIALCDKCKIAYSIEEGGYSLALPQLIKQTRYSDLFIANEVFYRSFKNEDPHYYINKALHQSECPIIVVPEASSFPENIVLAYNGSKSCIYAIKQFAYLFPELCNISALLVYESNRATDDIPEITRIKELIDCHFTNVQYLKLAADLKVNFNTWLSDKKNILLVSGTTDRIALSDIFKKSIT